MLQRNLPSWISFTLLAAVAVGILALVGWIKPYLNGPDLALATIYRPKPVPVKVPEIKEIVKYRTQIKTERVEIPVEVIREVPAKVEKTLLGYGITLKDLQTENKALATVLDVPKAPFGGGMAITVNTLDGKIDGTFLAKQAPFIQFGGIREAGIGFDPINAAARGYYRQDLVRVGPAIVNGEAFVSTPIAGGKASANVGVSVNVAVRF
jgi:hypothetical protein